MTWVLVVAGFAALIMLHEGGHFVVAKLTGMRVERFFLFFPPKLFSIKRGETEYGVGMIPLGGFVKITGMNPEELEPRDPSEGPREAGVLERIESVNQEAGPGVSRPGEPLPSELLERAYYNQPVWKRIAVIAAGPVVNIVLAFILLLLVYLSLPVPRGIEVDKVQADTPAANVLRPGDRILAVDGARATMPDVSKIEDVNRRIDVADDKFTHITHLIRRHHCAGGRSPGCLSETPVTVVVDRNGQRRTLHLHTYYDGSNHRYRLGVEFKAVGSQTADQSPAEAAKLAADKMWFVTSRTLSVIGRIFEPAQRKQISGVVGGSQALNQAIGFNIHEAIFVLAVISLSLGLINLFPFLPLDGGHIFWSLVEKIRGRRVPFSVIERASAVGFLLVIMLFVIGLTNDIGRLTS
ncbi:MAG TPA: RIP metalloprotease [Solirubrobacterales bacterium]|jgi:regulator of sigma E protease